MICAGGAITEIVYALGAEKSLVAVDTTSVFPQAALALLKIGYLRTLSAEGVLSLRPTLLLTTTEAGPPQVIAQLKQAGLRMEVVSADHSFDELRNKVKAVSTALGMPEQGRKLDASLQADWSATQKYVRAKSAGRKPKVLFILSHTPSSTTVAGQGTAAETMIQYAGGVNAMQGFTGYKPLVAESVIAAAPDLIAITREGLEAIGGPEKLWAKPGLALTPAAKTRRMTAPDALYFLGFGPRLPQAVKDLAEKMYGA
ncbi:MAG: ABC transporter substrate-binding protein [Candidatus Protistobacter heckmanni]|nr:ABC transporter substrate-binding protein [Candidatus Protistobacter heckmanni]